MTHYHIYGIGNALVDREYRVTNEKLQELGISKGVMTLIDDQEQRSLQEKLRLETPHQASGGSAANTIITAAQLGRSSFYNCKVANDALGQFYLNDMASESVQFGLSKDTLPEGHTGECTVFVTPDADRTMLTYLGISADIGPNDVDDTAIQHSDWAYIEGYLVSSDQGKAAAIRVREIAKENKVKTSFTFSDPNMVRFFKSGIDEILESGVDLLFCNEDEATEYAGSDERNTIIEALKSLSKQFAVTLGPDGALVWDGSELYEVPGVPANAVDTTGAGDTFAGVVITGLSAGKSLVESAAEGCTLAAKVVAQYGPRLSLSGI